MADKHSSQPVLVTGAAGGLGIHITRALSQAGLPVRAFDIRSPQETGRHVLIDEDADIEWFGGQGSTAELKQMLQGCRAVVHAAGIASLSAEESELFRTNRDFTARLFHLSCGTEVEHFVHISCASIYRADTRIRMEDSPTEPFNAFEDSKLAAEEALNDLVERHDDAPALTILRPGLLYGPGCTTMGAAMVTLPAILRGISSLLPGLSGGPRTNWCHVEDAASAVEFLLWEESAYGRIFNVADETALSFGEVLTSIIEGYDIDLGPSVRVPSLALWTLLSPIIDNEWAFVRTRAILGFLWRRVQRAHDLDSPLMPRLNRDAIFYVSDDAIVVADALKSMGWEPKWPDFREGIVATIRWYQDHGWAPRFDPSALAERRDSESSTYLNYDELMRGQIVDQEGERPLLLDLEISWPSLPIPPMQREGRISGTVTIPGISELNPVQGTIKIRWFPTMRLEYEFGFRDGEGRACRFRGTRRFDLSAPLTSLLHLEGQFVDRHGELIGTAEARCTQGVLPRLSSEDIETS